MMRLAAVLPLLAVLIAPASARLRVVPTLRPANVTLFMPELPTITPERAREIHAAFRDVWASNMSSTIFATMASLDPVAPDTQRLLAAFDAPLAEFQGKEDPTRNITTGWLMARTYDKSMTWIRSTADQLWNQTLYSDDDHTTLRRLARRIDEFIWRFDGSLSPGRVRQLQAAALSARTLANERFLDQIEAKVSSLQNGS